MVALLWGGAAIGLVAYLAQVLLLLRFRRRPAPAGGSAAPISVLKPLCGLDDELEVNLASFLDQSHPQYELLLGCRSERDPAWPLACALERKHPGRVRAVLQQGEPGLNPKVNQLITLARAARHDLWVVSDSNVRVDADYLSGVAAQLADPQVGLVTHPVVGAGAMSWGSRLDNLHLTAGVSVGVVAAKAALGQDIVVGKSMALRRAGVLALGGFESVKDVLAEDFVLGRRVVSELGQRVELDPRPVLNLSRHARFTAFLARYGRWSVMQRQTAGLPLYLAQGLLHPTPWAALACLGAPTGEGLLAVVLCAAARAALGAWARSLLHHRPRWWEVALSPVAEVLLTGCWLRGLLTQHIQWRGNRLRVTAGSCLEPRLAHAS
jgi:ceramide glucosyltransferase